MSLLGVSFHGVAEGCGRALMPIVTDFISASVLGAIKRPQMFKGVYLRNVVSILPAIGVAYWIYGLPQLNASTVVMSCVFLAYKVTIISQFHREANRESRKR